MAALAASTLYQTVEYSVWTRVPGFIVQFLMYATMLTLKFIDLTVRKRRRCRQGKGKNFEQLIVEIIFFHHFLGSFLGFFGFDNLLLLGNKPS